MREELLAELDLGPRRVEGDDRVVELDLIFRLWGGAGSDICAVASGMEVGGMFPMLHARKRGKEGKKTKTERGEERQEDVHVQALWSRIG